MSEIRFPVSEILKYQSQNASSVLLALSAIFYTRVRIVEASVISYMERLKKVKVDFSVDVLPYYMGRIFTYYNGLYHRDIGNIRSYELAQRETNFLYRKTP